MDFPKFLRVAVGTQKEMVDINGTLTQIVDYNDIDVKLTRILSKILGFSYELVTPSDGQIGGLLPDGNWTGSIGMIQRNETDLVVSVLSVSLQRLQVADFSDTYYRASISFATAKPTYTPELKAFLLPFSWEIWLLTLLFFLLMPGIFYLVFKKRYSIEKLVLATYCTFFRQTIDVKPRKVWEYLLMIFWKLAVGFLGYGYTGVLLSFLSFPPLTGIRTIPELAKAVALGKCECVTFPGAFIVGVLLRSNDANLQVIGESLKRNKGSMDVGGTLKQITKSRKIAFIAGKQFLHPLEMKYFVSEDEFFPALRSVAIQKDFCCKEKLNQAISRVWAYGLYYKLVADDIFLQSLKLNLKLADDADEDKERPLTVEEFGGAFIVLITGYILSTLVFILEVISDKTQIFGKLRNKNQQLFTSKLLREKKMQFVRRLKKLRGGKTEINSMKKLRKKKRQRVMTHKYSRKYSRITGKSSKSTERNMFYDKWNL